MRILIIEDDRKAARLLAKGLQEEGFVIDIAHSAEEGDELVYTGDYDLILLDWSLPGKQGVTLCQELRQRNVNTPILMLTARDAMKDRVDGLNTGADDYLTKPFAFEELLARIRALLRRSDLTRPILLAIADLTLNPQTHKVIRNGLAIDLTPKEYAILEILMRNPGEVISRYRLAEQVWHADSLGIDNLIDSHMRNLRKKIDPPDLLPLIQTIRGRGYLIATGEQGIA